MLWAAAVALPEMVVVKLVQVALAAAALALLLQIRADDMAALGLRVRVVLGEREPLSWAHLRLALAAVAQVVLAETVHLV
jgi:hypothetical protein